MKKRTLCLISLLLLGITITPLLHAQEPTVFGPKEFTISWLRIHLSFNRFNVDDPGDGVITTTKNTPELKLTGGFVVCNRSMISLREFFRGSDRKLEKEISLRGTNSLLVFLSGQRTASITLEVRKENPIEPPEVSFSAVPESIRIGESSTLIWTTEHADTVSINQGIGAVDLSGSMDVSPTETTTYTITATGPGGTEVDSTTVTVTSPPPTVSISADLKSIEFGESSTLMWSSTNAASCVLEPDVGAVATTGSTAVSPSETTIYSITATGPGGTATASVTVAVIYPVPIITISAEPEVIHIGGLSTLTWSTQYAASCVIEPDIGSVDVTGSITVSPAETTAYTIIAANPGETSTASVTVTVIPFNISISSPLEGATISRPDIMVKGTIANSLGGEVGITVNGIVAIVGGDQFVANHVPLEEGVNTINVTAKDWEGNMATASITVYAQTETDHIRLTAEDESGTSPLETTLRIEGSFSFTQEPFISYDGPGVVELDGPADNEYMVRITTPGIYSFTAEVTDTESNTYTDTIAVVVLDQVELDVLLKAKWEEMKSFLIDNNIEAALNYFHESSKENYQEIFSLLIDRLPEIASAMREIELISVKDRVAKYRIKREEEVQGQLYDITYYIYFVKDLNGLWRIESF